MADSALINLSKLFPEASLKRKIFANTVQSPIESCLSIKQLNNIYSEISSRCKANPEKNFFDHSLNVLNINYKITSGAASAIPKTGPVFVVSNHPFGAIDGLILGSILQSQREDSKILANFLLGMMPEVQDKFISVNPFGGEKATRANLKGLRDAGQWLKSGACLATFPAGIVAHYRPEMKSIHDGPWHTNIARLARKHSATVVPMHIEGKNSSLFHLLGRVHPRLRTAMLVRELCNKCNSEVNIRIGSPIPANQFKGHETNESLVRYFQMRSDILSHQENTEEETPLPTEQVEDITEKQDDSILAQDIENLPPSALLCEKKAFQVYVATADEIPHILQEIGRTREITFRAVGEGTGKALDLDQYDQLYHHIFLWNSETSEVVGAYRLGLVDEIISKHGTKGLYSSTIFQYSDDAFDSLGKTMELGRSYVIPKYQRRGTSLSLLWRGIIKFVRRNEGYSKLFGAVSISDDYHPLSKGLILRFLRKNKLQAGFAKKMKAHKKPTFEKNRSLKAFNYPDALPSLENVSGLVSELESDKKGVPTLLKHYLQLNGVILGFGVDTSFSDALDGFILVDLDEVNPTLLKKYEGED